MTDTIATDERGTAEQAVSDWLDQFNAALAANDARAAADLFAAASYWRDLVVLTWKS